MLEEVRVITKQRVECVSEFALLHNFKGINAQLHNRELIFFFTSS